MGVSWECPSRSNSPHLPATEAPPAPSRAALRRRGLDRAERRLACVEFVRMLCEQIGPRPACSEAEREAARLCAERLRAVGLEAAVEPFPSRPSATPWLASYLGVASVGALLLAPLPLVAFILSLVALLLYA